MVMSEVVLISLLFLDALHYSYSTLVPMRSQVSFAGVVSHSRVEYTRFLAMAACQPHPAAHLYEFWCTKYVV